MGSVHRNFFLLIAATFTLAWASTLGAADPGSNPWETVRTPFPGPPEAFGNHSAGCLQGSVSLEASGKGYLLMRPSRLRSYGQPSLKSFLVRLASDVDQKGRTLLIGDMGLVRGGPMKSGHHSHQTGLDVDLWYWLPKRSETHRWKTAKSRESKTAQLVLAKDKAQLNSRVWSSGDAEVLKFAASQPETDRIFVTAAVKKELCKTSSQEPWLAKIRPWWGHDHHFHVRLKCPAGETLCASAADPIPAGSGCDATLDWWFSSEAREKESVATAPTVPEKVKLPAQCEEVVGAS
jgi:penicillin-insensitive murein endopeptidase